MKRLFIIFEPLRKLYRWVLSWVDHPSSKWALGILAFAESSFFPIPPDVLLIALAFGARRKSFQYALICTVGSVLGGILGYAIGWGLWEGVDDFFLRYVFSLENFNKVAAAYEGNAFVALFLAGFTPIPYKVFTIAAGVFKLAIVPFILASVLGRGGRFFLVAAVIYFGGEKVRGFVEKRFELATLVLGALLVLGFVAIKWLL